MSRNILLVEPDYKTKFPPLGLMKISSYHKLLGDTVHFVKGCKVENLFNYWDRIYVTSLFTFNWKTTIDTINFYKNNILHGDTSRILAGGIMASLMAEEVWKTTGIVPHQGVINKPGMVGDDNDLVIDEMIPDYDLFNGGNYNYNLLDSYFGYSTRGCIRKCKFCGVHKLEPNFVEYKGLKPFVQKVIEKFGEKQHLVLFDNNILASKHFKKIIHDIMDLGFKKGDKLNNRVRYVDFNQGTDAFLLKKDFVQLISQINIHPLRIAFDSIKDKNVYCQKVKMAGECGIRHLSNYILYNFNDGPADLWERLKINIDLNKQFDLSIYSFPMKYIPLNAKDRSFINQPNWNWLFLRNVHRILNVLKGSVMTGEDFFYRAFGRDVDEFEMILHMPENIIMYRGKQPKSEEKNWVKLFKKLTSLQKNNLIKILSENRKRDELRNAYVKLSDGKIKKILEYYMPFEKNNTLPLFDSGDN